MNEFIDHLRDVFREFGPIEARRMFGGHGVYHDGLMFGLIVDETLYLKADGVNAAHFREQQLPQFEYLRRGKPTRLSYYRAPDVVLEDPAEAARWARRAFEAALRGRRT